MEVAATRDIGAGFVLDQEYPFVRTVWEKFDPDGPGPSLSWRPGVEYVTAWLGEEANESTEAHGLGRVVFTVVDVYAPPHPYPKRVFYTRRWVDPDGRTFGKSLLRMTTLTAFRNWIARNPMEKFGVEHVRDLDDTEKTKLLASEARSPAQSAATPND